LGILCELVFDKSGVSELGCRQIGFRRRRKTRIIQSQIFIYLLITNTHKGYIQYNTVYTQYVTIIVNTTIRCIEVQLISQIHTI